jgi:hypothetical protein
MEDHTFDKRALSVISEEVHGNDFVTSEGIILDLDEVQYIVKRGVLLLSQAFCAARRICANGLFFVLAEGVC